MLRRNSSATFIAAILPFFIVPPASADQPASPFHSLEADQHDERDSHVDGLAARLLAQQPVGWRDERAAKDPVVRVKLLGINDFHGQISAGRRVANRPVGGAAVLASYLKAAAANARDGAIIVHAGDHVGASPPASALLQDEPSISFLNQLANKNCSYVNVSHGPQSSSYLQPKCNMVGTLGNHEFDDGVSEVVRLLDGGNHPNGPFLDSKWRGARFPYISANVVDAQTGEPLLAPWSVRTVGKSKVQIGFIGAVLKETPTIVTPAGVAGVRFLDEAQEINRYATFLRDHWDVKTLVVTIHQGTFQTTYTGPTNPAAAPNPGAIVEIVRQLSDDIDVVISGHTHAFTNALIPNANGKPILVVSAFSASTAYDDIDLAISTRSCDVVEKSAVVQTTWGDEGPGLNPDVAAATLTAQAEEAVAPRVNRVVGVAAGDLTRTQNAAGESPLGNLIADAQRIRTQVQFSFMNPGGIRDDMRAGEVTWGELFNIQPFFNDLVSMDLTGAQITTLLEQQFLPVTANVRMLQISGLSYTWNAANAPGSRIVEVRDANGTPLSPSATYRVTVNSFMASGGDNFTVLVQGTNRVVGPVDLDALVDYVGTLPQPFTAAIEGRIVRQN